MSGRPERKVLWGLGLAIFAIAGMGGIFYHGTRNLIGDAERLEHTHSIINALSDFYTQIQDVHTASRGYAVSGDEKFLQHHAAAMSRAREDIQTLTTLAQNTLRERQNLVQLERLFTTKLVGTDQLILDRKQAGASAAAPESMRRQLQQDFDGDLRQLVNRMITDEREQLASRALESQHSSQAMLVVVVAGSLAEVLITIATAFAIRRYISERKKAMDSVRESEAELRAHARQLTAAKEALEANSRQLEQAIGAADAANRAKSAFLANMSHEIRTPVTAILGYAELVLEPNQTSSDRHDCLQVIRRSAKHLLELINDILDLSKIEAGRMTVETIPCNPAQVVTEVVSMCRPRAEEKRVNLRLEFDGPFPERIASDPLRLRQVLMNLLGNAVKFTNDGNVTVKAKCSRDDAGAGTLEVQVSDTGIGMSPEQLGRIFKPFTQADDTTTRKFGGTGLGLTISKRLTEMLGGDIDVRSEPGKGSTFTISVAAGDLSAAHWIHGLTETTFTSNQPQAKMADTHLSGRILLAEDGKDNQRLISTHLRRAGAEVTVADNGRIAVDLIKSQQHFDLVLMDMQMPELDGYGAARAIRQLGLTLPIIALTAHAMQGDREKCIAAGCTDYLTKPIDKNQLLWTIASYLNLKAPPDETPAAGKPAPAPAAPAPASTLRSEFATDAAMADLVTEFVGDLPGQVSRMSELLAGGKLDELRRTVHQLKGSGGGYGFTPITTVAAHAEQLLKHQESLDQIEQAVHDLIDLIRRVEGYAAEKEETSCLKKS